VSDLSPEAILRSLDLVNSYFQRGTPVANNDWTGGVYMIGNMAHYRASNNALLLQYGVNWGEAHRWQPAGYRGCHGNVGCPDNICCGHSYAEIYELKKDPQMIAGIVTAIDAAMVHPCAVQTNSSQRKDSDVCWWWIDALFMALPTYARIGTLASSANATRIWDAARLQYNITMFGVNSSGENAFNLWSPGDSLVYRDDSYIGKQAPNGRGVFWARGNGWAFAAMARALEALPPSRVGDRAEYSSKLVSMAAKLKTLQGADGCWRTSLEDSAQFPSIETTGTSLFVFGFAWGINNGLLASANYSSAAAKGWECLNRPSPVGAVAIDGRLGWCQPGGGSPQGNFDFNSTSDYCVGTYLLAGSELAKLVGPSVSTSAGSE
jgi:rhamnogalacturonyl hydrolase YesR